MLLRTPYLPPHYDLNQHVGRAHLQDMLRMQKEVPTMIYKPTGNYVIVSYHTYARLNRPAVVAYNSNNGLSVILRVVANVYASDDMGYAFYRGVYQGPLDLSPLLTSPPQNAS